MSISTTIFIVAMAVVCVADIFGRVIRLRDNDHLRTPETDAVNIFINTGLLIWAVVESVKALS